MKLKVIKVDSQFSKKKEVNIELNDVVDVCQRSWIKPGSVCTIKKDGVRLWYPKDCLIELDSLRNSILSDLGI